MRIACVLSIAMLLAVTVPAQAVRVTLGTASGGVAVYYNKVDYNNDGVVSGYDENPFNVNYVRAQFSSTNTDGMAFQFSPADLGGFNWNDIFSGNPVGSSQFGFDLIQQAPTYTSAGGVSLPPMSFYDRNYPSDGTSTAVIPPASGAWAINDYKGVTASGPGSGGSPVNSLFRGTAMTMTMSNVTQSGMLYTMGFQAELVSDGLIHWYYQETGTTDLTSWYLSDSLYLSGTLTYDSEGDTGADQMDFYAGDITFQADVIPEPLTMLGVFAGVAGLGGYIRRRRMA